MSKNLKIGDRVRVKKCGSCYVGAVGRIFEEGVFNDWRVKFSRGKYWSFADSELTKVPEIK